MPEYRLYIDESGDHTYTEVGQLDKRYLGLTGVLIKSAEYNALAQPRLERLKREYFVYADEDKPPVLVRKFITRKSHSFWVLRNSEINERWAVSILEFFRMLIPFTQVFTVVIDKEVHLKKYPAETFDPYGYCLEVLLWRVRGYLRFGVRQGQADVWAEARGGYEDKLLRRAYRNLREVGPKNSKYGTAQDYRDAFPAEELVTKLKDCNISGLQIADLLAAGQKLETLIKYQRPIAHPPSNFTKQLNSVVIHMINEYGQYLLE